MTEPLVYIEPNQTSVEEGAPDPEKVLSGSPRFRTWNVEDDGAGTYAGIWEATEGEWRVHYDEWEFCHVLEGHSVLTEEGGKAYELKAGDSFVIRRGFTGTWRVVETTRKHYVIRT